MSDAVVRAFGLCLELCTTIDELGAWWKGHQIPLKALLPHQLEAVVALKDRRKAELQRAG